MLKKLDIRNFTLIDHLEMALYPGFSVITGETGAGKSIVIGAIGLLLGNRADAKQVKRGCDKCIIEATFDLSIYHSDVLKDFFEDNDLDYEPEECLLRREVNANGKSRAFINDTPVTLALMRELGEQLIDVHSQHQNLLLSKEDFQLNVVDIIARDRQQLADYRAAFAEYRSAQRRLEELREQIATSRDNEDFLRFQQKELSEANLASGEQEQLEQEAELMSHAEDIKRALHEADYGLSGDDTGIVNLTRSIAAQLRSVADVYPEAQELAERLESCFVELKDISQEIASKVDDVEYDPQRFNLITQRLDTIYTLQQKFHVQTVDELLDRLNGINAQLDNIDNSDEELQELERSVEKLHAVCVEKAVVLTDMRRKSAMVVEQELSKLLVPLGIPKVRFKVEVSPADLSTNGADKVMFLFSANSSTDMQPVSQVASGGEIARVMLSLKAMISKAIGLPTIIFDEIDTGVSGRVAEQMAHIMRDMGKANRQVLCITHLPQIAAAGSTHYKVAKQETEQGTVSTMTQLSDEQRITEIAQMLSGSDVSQAAVDNAKSLLAL
ncbi:MAG: DNA repair protein RecN [Prevotella stercorea]|uniref:DNA repair protein RecN n=1 Tax=Leyella stercorea TaxID=363265 RepID=UPI0025CDBEA1|nr:DNA repair protein RecN [Prevotella sp.]MDD6940440.1 DNA repair protein RecN [Leyella stercorea]MCI6898071.1 DNA repair protein RecN [Prevotella sp.]MCI7021995.1 DNA repair protein RecN [Prevotella sp.]MCI7199048.1 DNA repair protein RecN [Prevotella sp.]